MTQPPPDGAGTAPGHAIAATVLARVPALIHPEPEGGYWAEVPSMPGCITEGETLEEVQAHLREAIEGWVLVQQQLLGHPAEEGAEVGGSSR